MEELIKYAIENGASDIHITEGNKSWVRIKNELMPYGERLTFSVIDEFVKEHMVSIYERFGYMSEGLNTEPIDGAFRFLGTRIRVNIYLGSDGLNLALRLLSNEILPLDKLCLPESIKKFTQIKSGLFIVVGTTGSGKSTTLASMIDEINHTRSENILTIEQPIEYMYKPDKCRIEQMEVGLHTKTGEINDLGIFETDEKGLIELYNLSDGWYQITETQAPDGYITKSESRELFIKEGEDKTVEFENTPMSALIIKKVDEKDGTVLSGAKFRLKLLKGTSGTGGTVIGEYETSANGTVAITRLQKGTYIVEEIQAPTGYEISEPSKTVYLTGNEQSVVTAEFKDKRYGRLVIEKVDSESGQHLSGAEFKVTTSSGEFVANSGGSVSSNGIYTTDVNGQISITDIKPGETLVITETKAPTGYIKDTVSKTVRLQGLH